MAIEARIDLYFATTEEQNIEQFVLQRVIKRGDLLAYSSEFLRGNITVVTAAVNANEIHFSMHLKNFKMTIQLFCLLYQVMDWRCNMLLVI